MQIFTDHILEMRNTIAISMEHTFFSLSRHKPASPNPNYQNSLFSHLVFTEGDILQDHRSVFIQIKLCVISLVHCNASHQFDRKTLSAKVHMK